MQESPNARCEMVDVYKDREEAGKVLASAVETLDPGIILKPLVMSIPRGGTVVAWQIASKLKAEIDFVLAKKIGVPGNPEYAIGAVDPDGNLILSPAANAVSPEYIKKQAETLKGQICRRLEYFRKGAPEKNIEGRTIFLVDDGLATGLTAKAAVGYLRRRKPHNIVMLVPVSPEDTIEEMKVICDEVVCPLIPRNFYAVGQWYKRFPQVSDEEVFQILDSSVY